MKTLVVYQSKTGFARKYAGMIATALGAQLMPLKDVKPLIMSRYENVVFGGGLYAASVNGLKKAKKMFYASNAKNFVIFATGATPNVAKDTVDAMWKKNLSNFEQNSMPHFYMQGGLAYEDMGKLDRVVMTMVANIKGKKDENGVNHMKESQDNTSAEFIEPLVECIKAL